MVAEQAAIVKERSALEAMEAGPAKDEALAQIAKKEKAVVEAQQVSRAKVKAAIEKQEEAAKAMPEGAEKRAALEAAAALAWWRRA